MPTTKVALVAPAGTMTLIPSSPWSSASESWVTNTTAPPAGAGALNVTVPVAVVKPATLVRLTVTVASTGPASGGFTFSAPTISSDGRFVVYQRSDGVILTYNNDSSDAAHYKQTTQIAAGSSPAVSGDGSKILVENGGNIVVYDQQGHVLTTITPADAGVAGALWKPALSANGHVIAFWGSDSADAHAAGQLFSYNQSTGLINSIASTASEVGSSGASIRRDV